ncbi:MAG: DUF5011 domain-containing protein [Candidatus Hydrogenedens sp.]
MSKLHIINLLFLLGILFPSFVLNSQQTSPVVHDANSNPLGIHLSRKVPREYNPGNPLEIVVNIYCDAPDPNYPVTAIGLYEMLPADWTFIGMRGITTEPPPIAPAQGTAGTLQFAWITPPAFPCTFAYTVQVPEGAVGVKTFSGQVEYRTNGPRLVSPPEITEINGIDRVPPEISLLGDNPYTVYQGTEYREPGYKATDNADGDITSRVQVSGNVDTNQPGEYTLTYTVRDNAGNNSSANRIVRVLERETQTPTSGGTVTTPVSGGSVIAPTPVPTTRINRPTQTTTNQQQAPPTATVPTSTSKTQTQKPEEVTFPRPDLLAGNFVKPNYQGSNTSKTTLPGGNLTKPNLPKELRKPQGIASGQPLKPFEIPKEIRGGARPPSTFEKNKIPTTVGAKTAEKKPSEITGNTIPIATKPPTDHIEQTPKQDFVITTGTETSASLASKENTSPLEMAPIKMNSGGTGSLPSFLGGFTDWWTNKTQTERRNLIGMLVLLGLLTLLCFITGRTAYQGITPQPRKKKEEIVKTETGVEN